jgi:hypothetical protein
MFGEHEGPTQTVLFDVVLSPCQGRARRATRSPTRLCTHNALRSSTDPDVRRSCAAFNSGFLGPLWWCRTANPHVNTTSGSLSTSRLDPRLPRSRSVLFDRDGLCTGYRNWRYLRRTPNRSIGVRAAPGGS